MDGLKELLVIRTLERLHHLVVLLELLESFPIEPRESALAMVTAGRPLTHAQEAAYREAAARAADNTLLLPGDLRTVCGVISRWQSAPLLEQEILSALLNDCASLLSEPDMTALAVRLLFTRRGH